MFQLNLIQQRQSRTCQGTPLVLPFNQQSFDPTSSPAQADGQGSEDGSTENQASRLNDGRWWGLVGECCRASWLFSVESMWISHYSLIIVFRLILGCMCLMVVNKKAMGKNDTVFSWFTLPAPVLGQTEIVWNQCGNSCHCSNLKEFCRCSCQVGRSQVKNNTCTMPVQPRLTKW